MLLLLTTILFLFLIKVCTFPHTHIHTPPTQSLSHSLTHSLTQFFLAPVLVLVSDTYLPGSIGGIITITGSGFGMVTGDTHISIGDSIQCNTTTVTDNQLTCGILRHHRPFLFFFFLVFFALYIFFKNVFTNFKKSPTFSLVWINNCTLGYYFFNHF